MPDEGGQGWPTLFLAWIAGYVDTVGYLLLAEVFTAHMSGNAAAMGAALSRHEWARLLRHGVAIPAFFFGVLGGIVSERIATRARLRSPLAPAFLLEALCVLLLFFLNPDAAPPPGSGHYFTLLCLLAGAMGLQTATLKRAEGKTVHTTFVTGMLTNVAQHSANGLYEFFAGNRRIVAGHVTKAAFFAGIFGLFMLGATCGGLAYQRWNALSLLAPFAGLLLVASIEWSRGGAV